MLNYNLLIEDSLSSTTNVPIDLLDNKHILITGGSGLIGTHLLYGLAICRKNGVNVKVTYVTHNPSPEYFRDLPFEHMTADLTNYESVKNISEKCKRIDTVIHCATYGQPNKFLENKLGTITLNTTTTTQLMKELNPKKFVFLSTSELYSGLTHEGFTEEQIGTTNPSHPRSCYIESKRCGEAICNAFAEHGIDSKIIRLCLAYGPGTKVGDKRVLNSFIEKALTQQKIEMLDGGDSLRTYGYISDCIYMILKIMLMGKQTIYNVGGVSTVKIKDVADIIGDILNVPVIIPEVRKGLEGTPAGTQLNLSKFYNEFGQIDFVNIRKGIERTIEWQRGLYL
jgi:nucleoside-diphosphate-sugar epimerase